MRKMLYSVVGMVVVGLVVPASAQLDLFEDFEDDAVGSMPAAYGPAYYGISNIVVKSGNGGIKSPDRSKKYVKFVGPKVNDWASSYWFNDADVNPPVMPLDGTLSADFYIDPLVKTNADVYLASTFRVNGEYEGEVGLGYTLLNKGTRFVTFHVTRYGEGHKGEKTKLARAGWYHLQMLLSDSDSDGKVDVVGVITDSRGAIVYIWTDPTDIIADSTYSTAGYQIQAAERGFVPLRVDNLAMTSY